MRSAPCASAPSHPFHVMPSRITRNSHRPRASDRTMVATEATSSLAALANSTAFLSSAEQLTRMDNKPNFSREQTTVGWISRKNLHSGRGRAFFLTSLFIELIDPIEPGFRVPMSLWLTYGDESALLSPIDSERVMRDFRRSVKAWLLWSNDIDPIGS